MIWQPQSYVFTWPNGLSISYYSIFCVLSFLLSIRLIVDEQNSKINKYDLILIVIITSYSSMIGGRLGYVIFYNFSLFQQNPLEIIKIWEGGISSHGATMGIFIGLTIYSRFVTVSFLWILDRVMLLCVLSGFFIRLGNFFNSEKIGDITTCKWGIIFINNNRLSHQPRHPIQLYEAVLCACLFMLLYNLKQRITQNSGYMAGIVLVMLFGVRFFIGFFFNNNIAVVEQSLNVVFVIVGGVLIFRQRSNI